MIRLRRHGPLARVSRLPATDWQAPRVELR